MTQSVQVLHVDDDASIADLTATYLEREDDQFTVETATNADSGLEIIRDRPPDCVVSDYEMPGLNGIEFLQAVREEYPDLPFILYTGKGSEAVASDAIAADVTDYLQKGSGSEQYELLANRIRNAVHARREAERADRQKQLMRLTEFAGDTGGFELHRETNTVTLTAGARRIIGRPEQRELSLEEGIELVHPDDRERIQQTLDKAVETGDNLSGTFRLQPDDGDERLLEVTVTSVIENGEVRTLRGAWNDITDRKTRREELEEYETIIEALTDAVYVLDENGRFTYINDEFVKLTGYDRETILGSTPSLIKDDDAVEQAEHQLSRLLSRQGPEAVTFEVTIQPRNGEPIVCADHMGVLPYEGEEFEGSVGILRDITERKEREQKLKRYNTTLEELLSASQTLMETTTPEEAAQRITAGIETVFGIDLTGVWLSTDDQSALKPIAVSKRAQDLISEVPIYTPDSQSLSWETYQQQETRYISDMYAHDQRASEETPIRSEVIVPLGRYGVLNIGSTEPDAFTEQDVELIELWSGMLTFILGRITQLELLQDREAELEQQTDELEQLATQFEEQYQYFFNEAPVMIVETRARDGKPVVEDCNQRFVDKLGYDKADVVEQPLAEFYSADSQRQLLDEGGYERSLRGEFMHEDRELVAASGDHVETILRAVPRYEVNDEVAGTIAFYVDISERRELKQKNERLDEFASVISHDLRNPLNVATGRLELARNECESSHLADVATALSRMEALIDDLLHLARQGQTVSERETIPIEDVVSACWRNVETGDATLNIHDKATLSVDRSRFRQTIENLFRNAIDHGGESATVSVGILDEQQGFYVADDGPGIPEANRKDVFDTGFTTTHDGTGFGLAIVRRICEAHGWRIGVTESEAGGARFEFTDVDSLDG